MQKFILYVHYYCYDCDFIETASKKVRYIDTIHISPSHSHTSALWLKENGNFEPALCKIK